jgi:cbb3-type cytochrome oxidase maturation protein
MEILILTYIATAIIAIALISFLLWGLRGKQFEDDYAPPRRILFENDTPQEK